MELQRFSIEVSESIGSVSAEWMAPKKGDAVFVFAHGAGASMEHIFMTRLSAELEKVGIATLRFNFPYMEQGRRRPDVAAIAEQTVMRAIEAVLPLAGDKIVVAGGKSFGGRMASQAISRGPLKGVSGLVFVGFPLHPAGKPGTDRARHLAEVEVPMLFLQGTRDALARRDLIEGVCRELPLATLQFFEGADHSFKAGKSDLIPLLAESIRTWSTALKVAVKQA